MKSSPNHNTAAHKETHFDEREEMLTEVTGVVFSRNQESGFFFTEDEITAGKKGVDLHFTRLRTLETFK